MAPDLLLRPRAAGRAAEGVVGQGRERGRGPAGIYPSRADEFARNQWRMEGRPGKEGGIDWPQNPFRRAPCRVSISRRLRWTIRRHWWRTSPAFLPEDRKSVV